MADPLERPGGRTARVRRAVLDAAAGMLTEQGFHRLDLAEVARRAEVGKTTVYRRWGTVPALVTDLLSDMAEQSVPRSDTGSLAGDLDANALLVQSTLTDQRQGRLFAAIIAAATCDNEAAAALERFYDRRIAEWVPCVEVAKQRGEVPADVDAAAVIRAVSAPLYYLRLTRTSGPTPEDAHIAARAALAAARAGAFVNAGS